MDVSGAAVPSVVRNRVGCSMNTLIWDAMEPAIRVPKNTVMICDPACGQKPEPQTLLSTFHCGLQRVMHRCVHAMCVGNHWQRGLQPAEPCQHAGVWSEAGGTAARAWKI